MKSYEFKAVEYAEFERLMAKLFDQISMALYQCEDDIQGWRYDELHESILHLMAYVMAVRVDQVVYDPDLHKFYAAPTKEDIEGWIL